MKILIVYYSMYGHVYELARAIEQGAASVPGARVIFRRVAEFEAVERATATSQHAVQMRQRQKDVPIASNDDLREADAVIFGSPTRYGAMAAQMKQFIDGTAQVWLAGGLEGKPAAVFTSTSTTHGGQESTLLSMITPLLHLGMVIVGVPYSTPGMLHTESRGSTPYGASAIAGPRNELAVSQADLDVAKALGKRVAEITAKLRAPANV